MSDEDKKPPKPPKPMKKTSAVPLKKETVRVTLKATPDADSETKEPQGNAPQAPASSAPKAPEAPKPPQATQPAGAPSAPAPTIPLKTAGAGKSAPAAPAPTVQLRTPGAGAPKTSALKTQPLQGGEAGTQQLPKATVKLGGAPGLGVPTGVAKTQGAFQTADEEEEEEANETLPMVLSIVAFVGALVVLAFQAMTVSAWDGWSQLF